jgi:hypothetical protein
MAEADTGREIVAGLVGAAMMNRFTHCQQSIEVNRLRPVEVDYSANAAHFSIPVVFQRLR